MAVIVDTSRIARADRAAAVEDAMRLSGIPATITHEPPIDQVHARIALWPLGSGSTLMHRQGSGVRLTRTPRQVRQAAPDRVSVTVLGPGRWTYVQGRQEERVDSTGPRILLTDQAAPYEFNRIGGGETFSLGIDHAVLGLPVDDVRASAERIAGSPVYPLVRNQILQLAHTLDRVPPGPAQALLGNSVTELVRALVISALADPGREHACIGDSLALRVALYITDHLTDPELTPARIAAAHHVSVRQLYNVWSRSHDRTLAKWIIDQRLDRARSLLARNGTGSIASVAARCGFGDGPFFARRFRAAYGVSPSEWRELARRNAIPAVVHAQHRGLHAQDSRATG